MKYFCAGPKIELYLSNGAPNRAGIESAISALPEAERSRRAMLIRSMVLRKEKSLRIPCGHETTTLWESALASGEAVVTCPKCNTRSSGQRQLFD